MTERVSLDTLEDSYRSAARLDSEPSDHLFITIEASRPLAGSTRHTLRNIDEVVIGRGPRRLWQRVESNGVRQLVLQVPDPRMSGTHARLRRTAPATWELTDCESTNGTWLGGQRVGTVQLRDRQTFELGHTFFTLRVALPTRAHTLGDVDAEQLRAVDPAFATLLPELAHEFSDLARIARSLLAVHLLGETGAGKEWLARAVHVASGRKGEFVGVNCAALPVTLIEAQLFGHVKGAFSGADRNQLGLVRAAHEGTLFLDEIADLPLGSQATLLRVLQEHEVTPVGGTRPIPVDLRVVSATHASLEQRVEEGTFRADLFARLDGFRFTAPALRDRREDFGLIVARVLRDGSRGEHGAIALHPELVRSLLAYHWPRNIRELRQDLLAAAVLACGETIGLAHLRKPLTGAAPAAKVQDGFELLASTQREEPSWIDADEAPSRMQLEAHLFECNGNLSEVARRMGKARTQIQRWMRRFALDRRSYRAARQ